MRKLILRLFFCAALLQECAILQAANIALQKDSATNTLPSTSNPVIVGNGQTLTVANGGTLNVAGTLNITGTSNVLTSAGSYANPSWLTSLAWSKITGAPNVGTVSSVGLTMPSIFSIANSPVTSSGTLAVTFATGQTANRVLASPDGTSGAVSLRPLVPADIPTLTLAKISDAGTAASHDTAYFQTPQTTAAGYGITNGAAIDQWGSKTRPSGDPFASAAKNLVLATPADSSGVPTMRALVAADIPSLTLSQFPQITAHTLIGNAEGSATNPQALTASDAKSLLAISVADLTDAGNSAYRDVGVTAGTVAAGDDPRFNVPLYTTLGQIAYSGTGGSPAILNGNTAATRKFLAQTGDGTNSAAPSWVTVSPTDIPAPTPTTLGGVNSHAAVSHEFLIQIGTDGSVSGAQPSAADLSNGVNGSGAVVLASGNAATATALQTARAINGVDFDGTTSITVQAAADTLTGNTLASNVNSTSVREVGDAMATAQGLPWASPTGTITSLSSVDVSDMTTGTSIQVLGFYTPGDMGYGTFVLEATTDLPVAGMVVSSPSPGRQWHRQYSGGINICWFGASPGGNPTANREAIQGAVDYILGETPTGGELYIPASNSPFDIDSFINIVARNSLTRISVVGDNQRVSVVRQAGDCPVFVLSGSYMRVSNVKLTFDSNRTSSEPDSSGILIVGVDSNTIGLHLSDLSNLWISGACYGVRNLQGSSGWTLNNSVTVGDHDATLSSVTSGSEIIASVGSYIQFTMDDSSVFVSQVASRSGNTVTLRDAFPSAATSGNPVTLPSSYFFSNSISNLTIENSSDTALYLGGGGTGSSWSNVYIRNGVVQTTWGAATHGVYVRSHGQNVFNQLNVESSDFSGAAIKFENCSGTVINSLHTESLKMGVSGIGILESAGSPLVINGWEVRSFEPYGAINSSLISSKGYTFDQVSPTPAGILLNGLAILGTKLDPLASLYWVIDDGTIGNSVAINSLNLSENSGFFTNSVSHGIVYPSTSTGVLKCLGTLIPPGMDGAILGQALNYTNDGRVALFRQTNLSDITFLNASSSLTTGAVGLYSTTGGGGTVYLNPTALSSLTSRSNTGSYALSNTGLSVGPGVIYLRTTANQASPTIVSSGTPVTYQRLKNTTNWRGLVKWTFGSSHGLAKRDLLSVSGCSSVPEVNGYQEVVFVESSTVLYTYRWTGYTSASDDSPHTESAISISAFPMVDVFMRGKTSGTFRSGITVGPNGVAVNQIRRTTATLIAGSIAISDASITANSEIYVGMDIPGGTPGACFVSSKTANSGYTITSTSALDTSTVSVLIIEP